MGFFSKLVKGVGKVVKGVATVATGIVSKLNIPIISGAAGVASDLIGSIGGGGGGGSAQSAGQSAQAAALQMPITAAPQTMAQSATFGGSGTINVGTKPNWLTQKTIVSWAPNWVVAIAAPGVVVVGILLFAFKRRRR